MPPELAGKLLPFVAEALQGTAFAKPQNWRQGVAIIRKERRSADSRGNLASWFAAHDLKDLARECLNRRVPPGSILVFVDVDVPEVAATGFLCFDLSTALRKTRKAA